MTTHANPYGAATTWVVSANTWLVTCFGFFVDLFLLLPHASKVLFLALSVTCLFVPQISREPVNGFAPNSHWRRVGPSLGRVWIIDREFVTSAKKFANFNEFSEIKKFRKKFVKCQSAGLPRVPGYPSGTRVINYPYNFLLPDLQRRFALYSDLLYE